MIPRTFIERFWASEPIDQLFVCMPFDASFDQRFNMYNRIAKNLGFVRADRADRNTKAESITTYILNGIANSKFVLIDLNDDPRLKPWFPKKNQSYINDDVLYETGIARTVRDPDSMVMIRNSNIKGVAFGIRDATIKILPKGEDEEKWIFEIIKELQKNHDWTTKERIRILKESIDDICLDLINMYGRAAKLLGNFHICREDILRRISCHRLMDLGILRFNTGGDKNPLDWSYCWTDLGKKVITATGLKMYDNDEEFKKNDPELYKEACKAKEEYDKKLESQK